MYNVMHQLLVSSMKQTFFLLLISFVKNFVKMCSIGEVLCLLVAKNV